MGETCVESENYGGFEPLYRPSSNGFHGINLTVLGISYESFENDPSSLSRATVSPRLAYVQCLRSRNGRIPKPPADRRAAIS